tara:strand:- start:131 stop:331 length:201 start_codon:yes stop_codon:yes gene_type:complete
MLLSLHFGRHFWLDDDNELMSCPSFVDGNPDTFNEDYVSEWDDFSDVDVSKLLYIFRQLVLDKELN